MGYTLDESDAQGIQEHLDTIYASTPDVEAISSALISLKALIETEEEAAGSDGGNGAQDNDRDKIPALKRHILATKPDIFKHLTNIPEDQSIEEDFMVLMYRAEFIAEMLRNSPPCMLAFIPYVEHLVRYAFRVDVEDSATHRGRHFLIRCPIGELLRPDPEAEGAHRAAVEALSREVKAVSDDLPSDLPASAMTEELVKKQNALAHGLQNIAELPLKPDAVPAFIEAGGLDALLGVLARGPLSLPGVESPNESLLDTCNGLFRLMDDSPSEALANALVERQAVAPLIKQMTYVCGFEGVYSASNVPRALPALAKWNDTLRKQIVDEAKKLVASDPEDLGPGAAVVLWGLIEGSITHDIDEMKQITKSKKYVSFFLAPCEPGADNSIMRAAGDALAHRIGQSEQLRKGIATPETVEKLVNILEFDCVQGASDASSSIMVLRELVLPGGPTYSGEGFKRVNMPFCQTFGEAIKARCEAAQALAPKDDTGEGDMQEPSEEGLANMKNVKMIKVLVEEQFTGIALLSNALLEYQQYLIFNTSPLTRRAGLELLAALCQTALSEEEFGYVPDIIDAFKGIAVYLLDDSRALIRALALQWLGTIMEYRHPNSDDTQHKLMIDFVTESVSEEKLVAMLKGNGEEVKAATTVVELIVRYSTGSKLRDRLKKNEELVELLWNGVFWDEEKAPPNKDEDISDDIWVNGIIEVSSGEALSKILDPVVDRASITSHIIPRLEQLKDKEHREFADFIEKLPAIASLAVLAPETGVLSRVSEMIADEDQLPYGMLVLRHLSQGSLLAKVSLGQSEHIYPALVKVIKEGTEYSKLTVLDDLKAFLNASTVSRTRFMKEGGVEALLDIISSDNVNRSRQAKVVLVSFLADFPEGAQATIDAGAIPILESKEDEDDSFDSVGGALTLLEELKNTPVIERIEFTPEAYAAFGKRLSDPVALEQLKRNLESSPDEKQLAIVGGLPAVLTDLLRSTSEPKSLLQVLQTLFEIDGLVWDGHTIAQRAAEQCGLWEALKPFVGNEDEEVSVLASTIRSLIKAESSDEAGDTEEDGEGEKENEAEGQDEDDENKAAE